MEKLLTLGLVVFGFLLGSSLYKHFGSYISFANRCLLKIHAEMAHRIDLWRPEPCKRDIIARKKRHTVITIVIFALVLIFFHPLFVICFFLGYFANWLRWRNRTRLEGNAGNIIIEFMPYISESKEDEFSKELASAYTYLLTGIRYRPPVA